MTQSKVHAEPCPCPAPLCLAFLGRLDRSVPLRHPPSVHMHRGSRPLPTLGRGSSRSAWLLPERCAYLPRKRPPPRRPGTPQCPETASWRVVAPSGRAGGQSQLQPRRPSCQCPGGFLPRCLSPGEGSFRLRPPAGGGSLSVCLLEPASQAGRSQPLPPPPPPQELSGRGLQGQGGLYPEEEGGPDLAWGLDTRGGDGQGAHMPPVLASVAVYQLQPPAPGGTGACPLLTSSRLCGPDTRLHTRSGCSWVSETVVDTEITGLGQATSVPQSWPRLMLQTFRLKETMGPSRQLPAKK